MENLWKRVLWHREHGVEDILNKNKKLSRKPGVKNTFTIYERCEIVEYDEDQPKVFSAE